MLTALGWTVVGLAWLRAASPRARSVSAREERARPARRAASRNLESWLAARLVRADISWAPRDVSKLWLAGVGALATLAWSVGGVGVAVAGAGAGMVAPPIALWALRDRRSQRLRVHLPQLLEEVARELRVGGTVASALERCARREDLVGAEARLVTGRVRLGVGLCDALTSWLGGHAGTPAATVARTCGAGLAVAAGTGGRAAGPLEALSAALREQEAAVAEARAQAAQGRLSAILLGALPLASLSLSAVFDAGTFAVLLAHPLGRLALGGGVGLEALGIVWMRRIVRTVA